MDDTQFVTLVLLGVALLGVGLFGVGLLLGLNLRDSAATLGLPRLKYVETPSSLR